MHTEPKSKRGGKREGAGRKSQGKRKYSVSLTADTVERAQERTDNFSGLLDRLLTDWLAKPAH